MIAEAVSRLVKKHKTNNPFDIAKQKNILLFFEPLGDIFGYFHTYKRVQMIHINNGLNELWQRFVCAHELGHSVLHKNFNTPFLRKNTLFSVDRIEREANRFAVNLLTANDSLGESEMVQEFYARNGIPREMIGKI